jgi:hypothetical protein
VPAVILAATGIAAAAAVRVAGEGRLDVLHPEPGAIPPTTYPALLAMLLPLLALLVTRRPGVVVAPPGAEPAAQEEVPRDRVA